MINYATQTYQKRPPLNLKFEVGYAESKHGINAYHLITAFNCFHWSHHLEKVFKSCHKASKSKGRMLGVTYPVKSVYWKMFVDVISTPK